MISVKNSYNHAKHHSVTVPEEIALASIELLSFRGAPVFIGTELAILHIDGGSITVRSKLSGVVDRVLVNDKETVISGQDLFELRNTNVNRDKAGNIMQPQFLPGPKPCHNKNKSSKNALTKLAPTVFFDDLRKFSPENANKHFPNTSLETAKLNNFRIFKRIQLNNIKEMHRLTMNNVHTNSKQGRTLDSSSTPAHIIYDDAYAGDDGPYNA